MRGGVGGGFGGGMGGGLGGGMGGALGGMLGGGRQQGGRGMGQTVAAGVILALLVKAARQQAARNAEPRTFDPNHQGQVTPQQGGMSGGLGGILGGLGGGGLGGLGGILGSLGGAGALGSVINQMQQKGYGQQAHSWVGTGHNEPIEPQALAQALGDDTIEDLQQQTGLPREQLLSELAKELPDAVHQITPDGRLPDTDEDLHRVTGVSG